MNPLLPVNLFLTFASRLKFRNLFYLTLGLFIFDILIPDFIPMIDEIILGLLVLILANWKKEIPPQSKSNVIEGEVVEEEDE